MVITRIYADDDGMTHFDEIDVKLRSSEYAPPAPPFLVTSPFEADDCVLFSMAPGWTSDWHSAPRLQFRFVLSGEVEIEVSDGEVRRFSSGDIGLIDDAGSWGHKTTVVGPNYYCGVFVRLSERPPERS